MKDIPSKNGLIYKYMNKYRTKNVIRTIAVTAFLIMYFMLCMPYITNVFFGSVPLDEAKFKEDAAFVGAEEIKGYSTESYAINSNTIKSNSYWQGNKYEFEINLNNAKNTLLTYTTRNTDSNFEPETSKEIESACLYRAEINGIPTLVLTYPHTPISQTQRVEGIFVEIPPVIKADLALAGLSADDIFYQYMLDTRGIQMESEIFDVTFVILILILTIYMAVIVSIQYINPLFTPTYRSINKYGILEETVDSVEAQLIKKGITKIPKKTEVYTDDWIVSRDVFKLKIIKNHTKQQSSRIYGSNL